MKELSLKDELAKLTDLARRERVEAREISPEDVTVADWVRYKCTWGCKGYGKHLCCPPYAPSPEETRKILAEYRVGLLLRFEGVPGMRGIDPDRIPEDFHPMYKDLILWVHDTLYMLEKTAFYDGFYKAIGFGAYPCIYCEHCVAEELLRPGGPEHEAPVPAHGQGAAEHGGGGHGRLRHRAQGGMGDLHHPVQGPGVRQDRACQHRVVRPAPDRLIVLMTGQGLLEHHWRS